MDPEFGFYNRPGIHHRCEFGFPSCAASIRISVYCLVLVTPTFSFFFSFLFFRSHCLSNRGILSAHRMMNGTLSTDYLADEMPYTPPSLGFVTAIIGITFTLTMTMIAVVFARLFIRINGGVRSVRLVDWVHLLACVREPPQQHC